MCVTHDARPRQHKRNTLRDGCRDRGAPEGTTDAEYKEAGALDSPKEEARAHGGDSDVAGGRDLQLLQRLILANDVTPDGDARVREVAA